MQKPILVPLLLLAALLGPRVGSADTTLLNVSYDPTRELYQEVNERFAAEWEESSGQGLDIRMSHGGSGKQARAVIDGLEADVVTLALASDVDEIAKRGLIEPGWQQELPSNSAPYTSTIVFLVREGNPKHIEDWDDLIKPGVQVITPNPKTSGGARWNYLAAWAWAERQNRDEKSVREFIGALYRNVPVLDTGARGSTTTFAQRRIGDVLLAWENEAFLAIEKLGEDAFEIVLPSLSIRAEPTVAIVDKVVDRKGTRKAAQAYLEFLYSPQGQEMAARNFYRPTLPEVAQRFASTFQPIEMVTIDEEFGGWTKAQKTHFADGGVFDRIFDPSARN